MRQPLPLCLFLAATLFAASCQREAPPPSNDEIRALFDVQPDATEAFRRELSTRFTAASATTDAVEAALTADGYDCGPDPTEPTDRACVREASEGACMMISIVRSAPFAPDTAQVIKACPQGAGEGTR